MSCVVATMEKFGVSKPVGMRMTGADEDKGEARCGSRRLSSWMPEPCRMPTSNAEHRRLEIDFKRERIEDGEM